MYSKTETAYCPDSGYGVFVAFEGDKFGFRFIPRFDRCKWEQPKVNIAYSVNGFMRSVNSDATKPGLLAMRLLQRQLTQRGMNER